MNNVIESLVMPGGWHKPELDRLGRPMPQPIRANTYRELIANVTKFRADNVIPIGDVKAEVDEYICKNFPHMCHNIDGATISITITHHPSPIKTLTDDMIQWLDSRVENHSSDELELRSEAQRRADICRRCKFNTRWNDNCGSCNEAVKRLSSILRVGNDVGHSRQLKACQILRHENRAAVWLRMEKIGNNPDLPQHCWAKR